MSARSPEASEDRSDVDAQFRSLLEGLRTSLPGVQVLFAFLLTAPLQSRFAEIAAREKAAFAVAFYASGVASVLLIAPSVHQRFRAPSSGIRRHSKRHLVVATWVAILGTVCMGVAIVSTVYLVSTLAFSKTAAVLAATIVGAITVWSWVYLPLVAFRSNHSAER